MGVLFCCGEPSPSVGCLSVNVTWYFKPCTPLQSAIRFTAINRGQDSHFNPRTPLQSAILHDHPQFRWVDISIHALHCRVRCELTAKVDAWKQFQSTHSITECDQSGYLQSPQGRYFNPRTPLQSAMLIDSQRYLVLLISIHALHYRVRSQDMVFWTPKSTSCD